MRFLKAYTINILLLCIVVLSGCSTEKVLFPVMNDQGVFGYVDQKGNIVLPCEYEQARRFDNGYAVVRQDEKEGIINVNGKAVIPIEYDFISIYDSIRGWYVVEKEEKEGVISVNGDVIVPLIYDEVLFFNDNNACVKEDNKVFWYDIEDKNQHILCKDKSIRNLTWTNEPLFAYTQGEPKKVEGIDRAFPKQLSWTEKWGVIDENNNEVVPEKYDYIEGHAEGRTFAYLTEDNISASHAYLLDEKGKVIRAYEETEAIYQFEDERAILIDYRNGFGVIDRDGNWVIEPSFRYSTMKKQGDFICAMGNDGCTFYDLNGKKLFESQMDRAEYQNGYIVFYDEVEGSGLMDLSGKIVTRFPEGYMWVY